MTELVCGIEVPSTTTARWAQWFAPERLPFQVDALAADDRAALPPSSAPTIPMELQDSFWIYGDDQARVWLTRAEFDALPTRLQRRLVSAQRDEHESWLHGPDGHYGPWWPDRLGDDLAPIVEFVERDRPPSRHTEVAAATWAAAAGELPGARSLAGTFADASGPNCFGTVMAAAGVAGAEATWMQREPFEDWLTERTVAVTGTSRDHDPGTVFVWRTADGSAQHACVTLGDGWMLNKPSQGWMSPRFVWTVDQTKRDTREPGWHLQRRRLS